MSSLTVQKRPEGDLLPSVQQSRSAEGGERGRRKFHRRSPKLLSWKERDIKASNRHACAYFRLLTFFVLFVILERSQSDAKPKKRYSITVKLEKRTLFGLLDLAWDDCSSLVRAGGVSCLNAPEDLADL